MVGCCGEEIEKTSKKKKKNISPDPRIKEAGGGMRLGKYEIGRTLGEGNFGKVKYAKNIDSGHSFALKILDKTTIIHLNITDQGLPPLVALRPHSCPLHSYPSSSSSSSSLMLSSSLLVKVPTGQGVWCGVALNWIKREIGTLKLLKHPNVVRLHEVLASKTKIYMVLEYVTGGELFDRIASKGKLSEAQARKVFQQLIDGVSYCHNKGVYHRDLKLENILVDAKGNIKISDFGLSALPQHFRDDGLLHTTCGSPNYVAPEILSNRGYDGATSDTWSCGVILFVILTGYLPFDDRNLAVLYQKIFKGDAQMPKWLSPGAQDLIKRILDPNPATRIKMAEIKTHDWFKKDYCPANPDDDEETVRIDDEALRKHEAEPTEAEQKAELPTLINAFQLIGMSSCLDLSGFFEKEDISERKIRFTSNHSPKKLLERIEDIVTQMGFQVQKKNGGLKVMRENKGQKSPGSLSVATEVFEISPSLYVVELRKSYGDATVYRQLCNKLSNELGVATNQGLMNMEV